MNTIFDAMPLKVLEELERIEITLPEIESRAFRLQAQAQDLRSRHDEIIASWKAKVAWGGLYNLVEERRWLEAITWISEPLPSGITSE
ncbi:MAG: hypothetical protein WC379_17740 [Methanoregula sp.]|jgi:hypothetical protein